jgi:WD40 repeat protein
MKLTLKSTEQITNLAVSPDGKWLAVSQLWGEGTPGLTIWDTSSWECVAEVDAGVTVHVFSASFNQHNNLLAYATSEGTVRIFDMTDSAVKQTIDIPEAISVSYAKSKDLLLAVGDVITVLDKDNKVVFTYDDYQADFIEKQPPVAAFYKDDTSVIITGINDDKLSVYDLQSGQLTNQFPGGVTQARYMTTDQQEKYLFVIARIPDANFLWKQETMERVLPEFLGEVSYGASSVSLHPSAKFFATGGMNGNVAFRSIATGEFLMRKDLHAGRACALAFSKDGKLLISAGDDGQVYVTDISGFIS